jgi:hypothetical protein
MALTAFLLIASADVSPHVSALGDYATPGLSSGVSLWISFDKGRVQTVHAKRHPLIAENYGVYEVRSDQTFESPDFEATFSRARWRF